MSFYGVVPKPHNIHITRLLINDIYIYIHSWYGADDVIWLERNLPSIIQWFVLNCSKSVKSKVTLEIKGRLINAMRLFSPFYRVTSKKWHAFCITCLVLARLCVLTDISCYCYKYSEFTHGETLLQSRLVTQWLIQYKDVVSLLWEFVNGNP